MRAVAVWNGRAFGPGLRVGEQAEVWSALAGAARAWGEIKVESGERARALRAVADGLTAHRDEVLALAARETGLAWPRLGRELDRTIGTLRLFAEVIDPAVDATARWRRPAAVAAGGVAIGPAHALTCQLEPLGPVVVFTASNFPLAYGVLGGDTASAWAAGCPVIVKGHPAHPATGALLVQVAHEALRGTALGVDWLGYVPTDGGREVEAARALLTGNSVVRAVGFTGSRAGGLALQRMLHEGNPGVPLFAEMGSSNTVAVLAGALAARGGAIAAQVAASILDSVGQQCTCPGIVLLPGPAGGVESSGVESSGAESSGAERSGAQRSEANEAFIGTLAARLDAARPRPMLSPRVMAGYTSGCERWRGHAAVTVVSRRGARADRAVPLLARTRWSVLAGLPAAEREALLDEVFGPAVMVIECDGGVSVEAVLAAMPVSLVKSVYGEPAEVAGGAGGAVAAAKRTAGRVVINGVPTGVRVHEAMTHSGPYPACNRPESTAVGPRALERWCRPVTVQGG